MYAPVYVRVSATWMSACVLGLTEGFTILVPCYKLSTSGSPVIGLFDDSHVRARDVCDLWRSSEIFVVFFQNRPIYHHACKAGVNS
jgi:hypothetical protein